MKKTQQIKHELLGLIHIYMHIYAEHSSIRQKQPGDKSKAAGEGCPTFTEVQLAVSATRFDSGRNERREQI